MSQDLLEQIRAYWNERPCNIRHSRSPIGTKEYFDEVESRKYYVEPHILKFADFPRWKNKRVLEIGFGIGTDAVNFCRAGAKYNGIELSNKSKELAEIRFKIFGLKGNLFLGDAEKLPDAIKGQKFDLVYSFGVLHHTPSIKNALKEIRNVLHEDSEFRFMVYAQNSWKNAMIKEGLDQPEAQIGCPIANTYTSEQLSNLLHHAGFKVIEFRQDHIFPYEVEHYKRHQYKKVPHFENMDSKIFRVLERNFGWHLLVRAKII